jgi:serine/threonine protein phosphatase 1
MSLTYAIPDLHGRIDLLEAAQRELCGRQSGSRDTIVFLGDYVDKGPDSKAVVERMREGLKGNWSVIALKGNHDVMMVAALRGQIEIDKWTKRGGDAALVSYGGQTALVPDTHLAWLDALPKTHCDTHRIYVHAGLDPNVPLSGQSDEVLLCKRYAETEVGGFKGRHIVHGHDNHPNGPLLYAGRTNLDTAAWKTGRLVVGIFDDDVDGGPIGTIEIVVSAPYPPC